MSPEFVVRPAREDEWPAAFRFIFQAVAEEERPARVAHGLDMVRLGELQREGIWVAVEANQVVGAVICLRIPGASALVWPPQAKSGTASAHVEDSLMTECCSWLRSQKVRIAQCLLEQKDELLAEPLLRYGFRKVTSLTYMRHDLSRVPAKLSTALRYQSYREADRALFCATLEKTYEGTLDCPELNGVRTIEEIITGHISQGRHDPDRWWLAFDGAVPVAVLLLAKIPEWHGWDLSYLGVVPEARRRGFAQTLAFKAVWECRQAGQSKITLSVDQRNLPAQFLYEKIGFFAYDRRDVYLGLWPASSEPPAVC
jgi:mycothiol synthase